MIEVQVQSVGIDQASKTPVVILQELNGNRVLPIWIGPGEASAIAMELANMKFQRPLTHDLAASLIRSLGGSLTRVNITRVFDNTYYAEMLIQRGAEAFSIDARPSDSIAIALRLHSRVFTSDELLSAQSIFVETGGPVEEQEQDPQDATDSSLTAEQLKEHLKKMNPEDLGRFNP